MTRQVILRPASSNRRERLLSNQTPSGSIHFGEVAGGTTAECAAICCCCPCGLVNLLVLAMYKLPAGLCKKALKKKKRQRLLKAGLFPQRRRCTCGCDGTEMQIHPVAVEMCPIIISEDLEKEVLELDEEMWHRFYSTGFWRSPSQREN